MLDPGAGNFKITSFFDVFAELSIDGGPFVPGPPRPLNLAPEPASLTLTIGGFLVAAGLALKRRRPA
jgi:hypothetical protein